MVWGWIYMHELGAVLRKAREAKGMTLEDIQNQTKISRRYLEAIEEGDFTLIPGEVYLKGFIVNYANTVELDSKAILDEYYQLREQKENTAATIAELTEPKQEHPVPESPMPVVSLPSIDIKKKTSAHFGWGVLIVTGFILIAAIVGVSIWQKRPAPEATDLEQESETLSATVQEPTLSQEAPEPDTQIVVETDVADLRLRATERVWIRLKEQDTGKIIEEVNLSANDTREWRIDRRLVLLIGNAGGLELSIRGGEFMTYGNHDQVITKLFEPMN
jgi:cytoskeletal protein RodZ